MNVPKALRQAASEIQRRDDFDLVFHRVLRAIRTEIQAHQAKGHESLISPAVLKAFEYCMDQLEAREEP